MKWIAVLLMLMGAGPVVAAPAVSIDSTALRFLPPETVGVVFIDAAGLRSAPLVQDALQSRGVSIAGRTGHFIALTGIDPQRDIDAMTVVKLAAGRGFAVFQGRIDKLAIEQSLKAKGKTSEAYLGQTLYRDGGNAFAILDNAAVVGQFDAVQKAIEQWQLPGSLPLRPELTSAMNAIRPGNQVWGVGDFTVRDLRWAGVRAPDALLDFLKDLRNGSYEMRVDSTIHARVMGSFADAKSAEDAAEMARGAIALARAQAATLKPDLIELLDGITIRASGDSFTVDLDASAGALREWAWH